MYDVFVRHIETCVRLDPEAMCRSKMSTEIYYANYVSELYQEIRFLENDLNF